MKKNARWGFFAILLAAVLASEHAEATTVLFRQGAALANVDAGNFPLPLLDTTRQLALTDGPKDNTPGEIVFGTLPDPLPLPAGPKSDRPGVATDFRSSRPSLSEDEMAVWKSNGEPEDWLFRMQFAKASVYEAPEPSPLIPIPEPTSGVLVILGITSRAIWRRYVVR